ncbi:anti-sigma regulatory factor [Actinomadura sp. 7K507]|uniref:anti-sigma regulatory factor n=1 Tax=Actinomadura sp. 7K507 TaxID=2530365 RepID=UPI00104A63B8|nr:anti-sigma regulatory factor [Actinomadura sp. 7K507]TDC96037.1 anti-sigma regulatory factor [Actinomadura sp. 7K507]
MTTPSAAEVPIASNEDVVRVRQLVRAAASEAGLSLVNQTKIITAASELARNTLVYGGGGSARIERTVGARGQACLRVTFTDDGPGIADTAQAMADGWTTGDGLGLGLSGARRLADEFELESSPGKGTRVVVVQWIR